MHAFWNNAITYAGLFVDSKLHIAARDVIVGAAYVTFHCLGVVDEVDDLLQLHLFALEVIFLFDRYRFVDAVVVFFLGQCERKFLGFIHFAPHLVNIPIAARKHVVAYTHIGAEAFHLLHVPQGEGVVIATGEDDRVRRQLGKIVSRPVAGRGLARTVVLFPTIGGQNTRHGKEAGQSDRYGGNHAVLLGQLADPVDDGDDAKTNPNGEGIE